ncbi:Gfo/Idh/MocA family protein [Catenovulum agarivorans]|uniref:Gfo/Idh/MocA family protein n=1 Tax=Catenovulum agarivorans TaxID=1172192 RepID=UPI00031DECED|nr:Gfo/Idh/MocA family oxidoreductase [Catenovulum agarivorans]
MNKLKVACVGTGYFAQFHYQAWQRLSNVFPIEVIAVVNRNIDNAKRVADEYGIPNVASSIADIAHLRPDLIDVITPPVTHDTNVRQAIDLGANVICQKPFCESLSQAESLVEYAKQKDKSIIIHENFRFMPWYRKLAELLSQNLVGDVLNVSFKLRPGDGQGNDAYLARQPYFQQMPKFLVHETAIHIIDVFRFLFGEITQVSARLRKCNPVIQGEDSGVIHFDMANNISALFDGNRCLDHAASNHRRTMGEMWIEGTQGCLRLDGEARIWHRAFNHIDEQQIVYPWQDQAFGGDCVFLTIEHIVKHYFLQTPLENTAAEYLTNIKIVDAVYHSNEQKRVVLL